MRLLVRDFCATPEVVKLVQKILVSVALHHFVHAKLIRKFGGLTV